MKHQRVGKTCLAKDHAPVIVRVDVVRLMPGIDSGPHGRLVFKVLGQDQWVDHLDLEQLVGSSLEDGAVLKVTLQVLKKGTCKPVPWKIKVKLTADEACRLAGLKHEDSR